MPQPDRPILLATRGSALALVQTRMVLAHCRSAFPELAFDLQIIKTTGDKLQTAPPDLPGMAGTKGLFTKELEVALLQNEADLAVHSLKDLPTDLPEGLQLSAVLPRADVRDVLIYRDAEAIPGKRGLKAGAHVLDFPPGATIATSSTRRQAQVLALRPDLHVKPVRGNVGTRLQKLADQADLDGMVLAAAGLHRLGFEISAEGRLLPGTQERVPEGLRATYLSIDEMLPCVGQGAIGLEGRRDDALLGPIFSRLNHVPTWHAVIAERAFLHAMGGGCLSPVAAYAEVKGEEIVLRAVSFREPVVKRAETSGSASDAAKLGAAVALELGGRNHG
jgi:hydroxymethylbilane synthase